MGVGTTKNNGLYILPSLHQLQNLQNEVRVPSSQSNHSVRATLILLLNTALAVLEER